MKGKNNNTENGKSVVLDLVEDVTAVAIYKDGKAREILDSIKTQALAIAADATTVKGRKELRSVAYAVARCKTTLDTMGKDMVADLKKKASEVDRVRRMIREECESTQAEVLRPVTEWEAREQAVKDHIHAINGLSQILITESADDIKRKLERLGALRATEIDPMGREEEIQKEIALTEKTLSDTLEQKIHYEQEQAELKRLREEKEKRDREDAQRKAEEERKAREKQIADEAAARATAEAEERIRKLERERENQAAAKQPQSEPQMPVKYPDHAERTARAIEDSILELDDLDYFVDADEQIYFARFLRKHIEAGNIQHVVVLS